MWEDSKTGSKWVIVTRCYFPGDLPENVGRPCAPESNEVNSFLVYIFLKIINMKNLWLVI
jgi:hypothetical protein